MSTPAPSVALERISLKIATGLRLEIAKPSYTAHLYRQRDLHFFAFTSFELRRARADLGSGSCDLWLGDTCYEMPLSELTRAAAFLGIPMPEATKAAS